MKECKKTAINMEVMLIAIRKEITKIKEVGLRIR